MFLTTKQQNKIIIFKHKKRNNYTHWYAMKWKSYGNKNIIIKIFLRNLVKLKLKKFINISMHLLKLKTFKLAFRMKKIYIYRVYLSILYTLSTNNTNTFFKCHLLKILFQIMNITPNSGTIVIISNQNTNLAAIQYQFGYAM